VKKEKAFARALCLTGCLCFSTVSTSLSAFAADAQSNTKPAKITQAELEKLIKSAPNAYNTHLTAAKFYDQEGSVGESQNEYRLATKCKGVTAEAYKRLAQQLLRSSDYVEAEKIARQGLKLFPHDYGMLLTTGYVLHNEHKLNEALEFYKLARDIQPKNPEIYVALADLTVTLKDPQKAKEYIDKAVSLGKPSELVLYQQAKILCLLGHFDQALKPLATNFESDPLNLKNDALYLSVLSNQKMKKEAFLVQLCMLAPANDKEIVRAKTNAQELMKDLPDSDVLQALAKAESFFQDKILKGRLHFAMGAIYDRLNRPAQAIVQYQAGLALDPSLARGYLRLGEDLESFKKNLPEAMKNYQKAFSLDKKDPEIQMRLNLLKAKMK